MEKGADRPVRKNEQTNPLLLLKIYIEKKWDTYSNEVRGIRRAGTQARRPAV
jgi:hypothetical protein